MATALCRLVEVEHLSWTRPEHLEVRTTGGEGDRCAHDGDRVDPRICDPTSEDRDDRWDLFSDDLDDPCDLFEGHDRCGIDLYALGGEVADQGQRSEEHTTELQSRGQLVCRL